MRFLLTDPSVELRVKCVELAALLQNGPATTAAPGQPGNLNGLLLAHAIYNFLTGGHESAGEAKVVPLKGDAVEERAG